MRRFDSNMEWAYKDKLTRVNGKTYETRTDKWERLGTKHHTVQRFVNSQNDFGVYTTKRVGLHSQDLHKGNEYSNRKTRLGGTNTISNELQDHYRKLGEYYKKKYGV